MHGENVPVKAEQMRGELELLSEKLGYKIRYEFGDFKGGMCHVQDANYIIVPKRLPAERQVTILARELSRLTLDNVFLLPAVRQILDDYRDTNEEARDDDAGIDES